MGEETVQEQGGAAGFDLTAGTYASRLAAVRCSADHALWALRHGADWRAAWGGCPRPDWLAEAWVLTQCGEGGNDAHRRLVRWLGFTVERAWTSLALRADAGAKARVARSTVAVRAATGFASNWGRKVPGAPPDFVAFMASSLFDREEAEWTLDEALSRGDRSPDAEARAVAHAALQTACSILSGPCPSSAMCALAWAYSGAVECPELSRRFAEEFECPPALRCELPS